VSGNRILVPKFYTGSSLSNSLSYPDSGIPIVPSGSPEGWYDASQLVLNDDDDVATFTDLTANSRDLVQSTESQRPTFKTGILNSLPVVRFTKADFHHLYYNQGSDFPEQAWTIFIVYAIKDDGGFLITGSEVGDRMDLMAHNTGNRLDTFVTGMAGWAGTGIVDNDQNFHYLTWSVNGSSTQCRRDGVAGLTIANGVNPDQLEGWSIGANQLGTGDPITADYAEVIVYSGVVDPTDNEAYLKNKYGL